LGVSMRNRKLRNIRPSGAFWPEVTSSPVVTEGLEGCAHVQPEVAQYPP
jgi:hypothetical protein